MRFNLFKIPVTILPTFWVFLLVVCFQFFAYPQFLLLLLSVLCFSLLFHELGHALAARKFGKNPEITLEGFGGYAQYDSRGLSEEKQCIITLCGPLFTSLLIGISFFFLKNSLLNFYPFKLFCYTMMRLNIYWLIVNMAPLMPLDGGKITQYLLVRLFGFDRGRQIALILGNVTALVGGIYFLLTKTYLFAYLFFYYGWQNLQTLRAEYKRENPSQLVRFQGALDAIEKGDVAKGKALLEKLTQSKDDYFKVRASETLAHVLEKEGDPRLAYKTLLKVDPDKLKGGKWLLCKLAYEKGNYQWVEKFSREIYEIRPTFETALLNAKTFSRLKNPEYSAAWLHTALQFEEAKDFSREEILSDTAFQSTREHPAFQTAGDLS